MIKSDFGGIICFIALNHLKYEMATGIKQCRTRSLRRWKPGTAPATSIETAALSGTRESMSVAVSGATGVCGAGESMAA